MRTFSGIGIQSASPQTSILWKNPFRVSTWRLLHPRFDPWKDEVQVHLQESRQDQGIFQKKAHTESCGNNSIQMVVFDSNCHGLSACWVNYLLFSWVSSRHARTRHRLGHPQRPHGHLSERFVTKNATKRWDCEWIWQDSTCGLYWSHHSSLHQIYPIMQKISKHTEPELNQSWASLPLSSLVFSQTSCTGWTSSSPRKASQCWSTSPKPHNHA